MSLPDLQVQLAKARQELHKVQSEIEILNQEISKRDEQRNATDLLTDIDFLEQEVARKKQLIAQRESSSLFCTFPPPPSPTPSPLLHMNSSSSPSPSPSSSSRFKRIYVSDDEDEEEEEEDDFQMSGLSTPYVGLE